MLSTSKVEIQLTDGKAIKERRLVSIPLFHAFAAPLCQMSALRYGVTTFIMRRFSEAEFLKTIEDHNITETAVVPPMLSKFLSGAVEAKRSQLRSLRLMLCAGAHLEGNLEKEAHARLLQPQARIAQVWGLTECGWISTFFYPEKDQSGAVGRALPGYRLKYENAKGFAF